MRTLKVVVHKGTWLGIPGTSTTFHLDKRPYGLRVGLLELEGRHAEVKLIEGDGRSSKCIVHAAGEL